MMQTEVLHPSWTHYYYKEDINQSPDDQAFIYGDFDFDIDSYLSISNDFYKIPPIPNLASMFTNEYELLQFQESLESFDMGLEGFESILSEENNGWSPSQGQSMKSSEESMDNSLTLLPLEAIDNQVGVFHLLKAYGEAIEKDQRELAEVIMTCLSEKVSPDGEALERIAYNLLPDQGDCLLQESIKNYWEGFRTFYQMFPYGRFAHFAANSTIIGAIPDDAEIVHVVDFDLGEGVQWPAMIEAIARKNKMMRLTAMKWEEDEDLGTNITSVSSFEGTKRRLSDYAALFGLQLTIHEMNVEELVREMKKTNKTAVRSRRGGGREWLVFNCMVGLPHMGKVRSRKQVKEFLQVAKELLSATADNVRGILTLGDGDACEKLINRYGFGAFFDGNVEHYQVLIESMKYNFPAHLTEARMTMENLFVKPFVSSQVWFQAWEEMRQGYHLQSIGLKEIEVSRENLMEVREIVSVESLFAVTIGGERGNEMVLEWRGTPLVRVSSWRN